MQGDYKTKVTQALTENGRDAEKVSAWNGIPCEVLRRGCKKTTFKCQRK